MFSAEIQPCSLHGWKLRVEIKISWVLAVFNLLRARASDLYCLAKNTTEEAEAS